MRPLNDPARHQGNIMIVDDNPANLKLLEDMLLQHGYEVQSFPRGRLAISAADQEPPDLILLDINMPEMTGFELCQRLKANRRTSGIPVIFLSAMNAPDDKLQGFRCGGVDYISKPFQFEEVHARVTAHVRLRQLQQKIEADNRHLHDRVEAQVKKLADAQMETIFAIAKLAEDRDDNTGKHLERVQTFCRLLAQRMSGHQMYKCVVDRPWIRNIFYSSPLHDIGKVAISDRILRKAGSLTAEEFAIMKTHAARGSQTLKAVHHRYPDNEFIAMGIDIARSHHERWDGAGYPDGLAGEDIPLCARVLAIADCYDALRSKRCYKPSIAHDKTCAIIFREAGSHFDPGLVGVFSEIAEDFRNVWDQMQAVSDDGENADLLALARNVGRKTLDLTNSTPFLVA